MSERRFRFQRFINDEGARNLLKYTYKGVDKSIISNYILQPIWNFALQFIPLWMAPNLITLVGFVAVMVTYGFSRYYCPDLQGEAPRWLYLANAGCLFFYMMMDNLDGKQARRTKSSSPLGQLFDHGCDALNCTFSGLTTCATLQTGPTVLAAFYLASGWIPFYFATWEEYHTGVLLLREIQGPTEGLLLIMLFHIVAFVKGPGFWSSDISDLLGLPSSVVGFPLPKLRWNDAIMIFTGIAVVITVLANVLEVARAVNEKRKDMDEALSQLVPFLFIMWLSFYWMRLAPEMYEEHTHSFLILVGILVSTMVSRMILAHVCDQPFRVFNKILLPLPVAVLNSFLVHVDVLEQPLFDEASFLYLYLAFATTHFMLYVVGVIEEITSFLGIRCFKIPYPPPEVSPIQVLREKLEKEDKEKGLLDLHSNSMNGTRRRRT